MARRLRMFAIATLAASACARAPGFRWSHAAGYATGGVRDAQCVTRSGTETGLLGPGDGLDLTALETVTVRVRADSAMNRGGVLRAWLQEPSGAWRRVEDGSLDLVLAGRDAESFREIPVPGRERLAYLPSGAGPALTIEIIGSLMP